MFLFVKIYSLGIEVTHSFPIHLWESFSIVVNPMLLVKTKLAFTFDQE